MEPRYTAHETSLGWQVFKNYGNGSVLNGVHRTREDAEAKIAQLTVNDTKRFAISDARARAKNQCECEGECARDVHAGRCTNINDSLCDELGSTPVALKPVFRNHDLNDLRPDNIRLYCQLCRQRHDAEELGSDALFDIAASA